LLRSSRVIRVRFHGRGGQGMKTASRIVGTAAVLDGHVAQDSPVYGAERRGAPMSAFVRVGDGPIFERGFIPSPDIVAVADDTLLDDASARPLAGLAPTGALVLSTSHSVEAVRQHTAHRGPIVAGDFLAAALAAGVGPVGVSTAVAAAVGRLLGLSAPAMSEAVRQEVGGGRISARVLEASVALAGQVRETTPAAEWAPAAAAVPAGPQARLVDVTWVPPEAGTARITAHANTPLRRTGNWRVYRPVIDTAKCTRCWICFLRCPDGAIVLEADDSPRIDEAVCKGCLICAEECPTKAITSEREVRAWPTGEPAR
jgi:pyruvate ferredoxin oxidoreductase gamma subunit